MCSNFGIPIYGLSKTSKIDAYGNSRRSHGCFYEEKENSNQQQNIIGNMLT
jgi:hypothetical protein